MMTMMHHGIKYSDYKKEGINYGEQYSLLKSVYSNVG
jgi:hypothetical protein